MQFEKDHERNETNSALFFLKEFQRNNYMALYIFDFQEKFVFDTFLIKKINPLCENRINRSLSKLEVDHVFRDIQLWLFDIGVCRP